jgi:hypothetical protein
VGLPGVAVAVSDSMDEPKPEPKPLVYGENWNPVDPSSQKTLEEIRNEAHLRSEGELTFL